LQKKTLTKPKTGNKTYQLQIAISGASLPNLWKKNDLKTVPRKPEKKREILSTDSINKTLSQNPSSSEIQTI